MNGIETVLMAVLFYGSGLLVWPICALLWRKKRVRTTALKWVFFSELLCLSVLYGFACFSQGLLEHGYYWFFVMIIVNLLFIPIALLAVAVDYGRIKAWGA